MSRIRISSRVGGWALVLPLLYAGAASALPSYGTYVDTTCTAMGAVPAKPFNPNGLNANSASQVNCGLCHTNAKSPNANLTTAGDQFRRSGHTDVSPFCTKAVGNQAPILTPVAAQAATIGQAFSLTVSARDPEGGMLLLSVANAPAGSTFADAGNGSATLRWTPSAADLGAHTVTFHAADTGTPMAVANLDVTIAVGQAANLPPVLAPIGNQQLDPGQTLAFTLSATDPENQALSYSATGLPTGATLVGASFSWTPDASQVGQHPITFRVTDAGSPAASDSEAIVVSVGRINRPPVLAPIGNRQGPVGSELRFALSATDPDGDALALVCTGLPADATFTDHGDGSGEVVWLPAAAARANVVCSATDSGTPPETDSESFTLTANDPTSAAAPQLDDAEWIAGEHGGRLRLRGSVAMPTPISATSSATSSRMTPRPAIDVLAVFEDGSQALLGSGRVGRSGRFRLVVDPFVAPCQVAVGSGGVVGEPMAVRGAPAGCDTDLLTRARAELSCDGAQLKVSGDRGPIGGQAVVSDADGGERLGSFPVSDKSGRFGGVVDVTTAPAALTLSVEVGTSTWTADQPITVRTDDDCTAGDDEADDEGEHEVRPVVTAPQPTTPGTTATRSFPRVRRGDDD